MTSYTEEEAAEQQEWIDYVPEMLTAIQAGYLDDHFTELTQAMVTRRREVLGYDDGKGGPVRMPRTAAVLPTPGAAAPALPTANAMRLPIPFWTQQEVDRNGGAPSGSVHIQGLGAFRKHDIAAAGQTLVNKGLFFPLKGTRKYPGCTFRLMKINRTRCEVVVETSPRLAQVGNRVSCPIEWVVESMRLLDAQ